MQGLKQGHKLSLMSSYIHTNYCQVGLTAAYNCSSAALSCTDMYFTTCTGVHGVKYM